MRKHLFNFILIIVMLAGLSLLLYPSFSDYWNSFHQSRAIATYHEQVSALDTERYEEIRNKALDYNSRIAGDGIRFTLSDEEKTVYDSLLRIDSSIMGYIDIPRISVSLPIYHGTEEAELQTGIGHLEGTSLPIGTKSWSVQEGRFKSGKVSDPNDCSHCVLSGHRGLPSARLFTDLDKLVIGDTFTLTVLNETLTYEVDQIRIVLPQDLSELQLIPGEDLCTLVTCTPYGINTHRLLVRGHRIANLMGDAAVSMDATQINTLYTVPFIAVPIILMLLIATLVITNRQIRHRDAYRNSTANVKMARYLKKIEKEDSEEGNR